LQSAVAKPDVVISDTVWKRAFLNDSNRVGYISPTQRLTAINNAAMPMIEKYVRVISDLNILFFWRVSVAKISPKWIPEVAIATINTISIQAESNHAMLRFFVPKPHVPHADIA
jgi:hypothetical protein